MTLNTGNQHSTTAASRASITAPVSNIGRINNVGISRYREKVGSEYILETALSVSLVVFLTGVVSLGLVLMFASKLHTKHDGLMRVLNDYKARTCGS